MKPRTLLTVLLAFGLLFGVTLAWLILFSLPRHKTHSPARGIDLDVTTISRTPRYYRYEVWYTSENTPYLRPGTEGDQPGLRRGSGDLHGAHREQGNGRQRPLRFRLAHRRRGRPLWHPSWPRSRRGGYGGFHLALGAHDRWGAGWGEHTVAFVVDPEDAVAETYESNNVLQGRTDALSLVLALTPELYAALETPVDPVWPFSAEDWLQKQISALNAALAASVYPSAPQGATERLRLEDIQITTSWPPTDFTVDGGFWMQNDDRYGNAYYHAGPDISGGLLHELGHQLGLIDLYNLDVALEIPQVLDGQGNPVQMEYWPRFNGLMGDPGIDPVPFRRRYRTRAQQQSRLPARLLRRISLRLPYDNDGERASITRVPWPRM